MTAIAFDTYAMVRRLKASGFSEDQAEAITGALKDGRESDLASLATKTDLRESEVALRADLRDVETSLKADLRETEDRLEADLRESEGRLDVKITDLSKRVTDLSHRVDLGMAAGRADMRLLEQRMTVKLGALVAAGIGIMIAAFRYLPPAGH
ncbi:DUF1640 domain-containing protein [Methylobacterium sp. 17Sr1-1]|uniref:DUF1640 domain-containing protein n=1 Tax=Methylobacterium sp. 17Sr1-1 TaxID=2202826 RepID=UPI000D6F5398|nr:DUF1640 domain-containing protein [Methylobacterium sp. 17Sr1-1]AWN55587.1 hypothetical protein DK412_12715 [Methylobacterium sp. 17Sr1-1]